MDSICQHMTTANDYHDIKFLCDHVLLTISPHTIHLIDPYCQLMIGTETFKTRTIDNGGKHPEWNQSFLFNLTGVEDALHIKVSSPVHVLH